MKRNLKVFFLAAEADPFVKIGGLGDVAGSLPRRLRRFSSALPGEKMEDVSVDVRLAIPLHSVIWEKGFPLIKLLEFAISADAGAVPVTVYSWEIDDLPVYLIGGGFIPPEAPVYSSDTLADGHKFTGFSVAALELARRLDWSPDILHANDWHTAPAVVALAQARKKEKIFASTQSILGIHNLPFLGVGAGPAFKAFGLAWPASKILPQWARQAPLPLGLLTADRIVAVSPTYAREILTPEHGCGLEKFLLTRKEHITGILNGLDTEEWDPQTDPHLVKNYSCGDWTRRLANKQALQEEAGLAVEERIPLFGVVARLYPQKGMDLLPEALRLLAATPGYAARPWQMVVLGTGDPAIEATLRQMESDFPGRVRVFLRYDPQLSHRIYAGADMLLIPSRYEPCGLTQMIAMRYGCVPLGRATGGLRDTIQDVDATSNSTGFLFANPEPAELAHALGRALALFAWTAEWRKIQQRGMQRDFSWERSARQYLGLYQSLISFTDQVFEQENAS